MAIPDLIVDRITTPGVMAAKLLLPWGSATDGIGRRGAHQWLAATLSRGCGPFDHRQLADLVEGRGAGLRSDAHEDGLLISCLLYTSPSPRDREKSRMPSSA